MCRLELHPLKPIRNWKQLCLHFESRLTDFLRVGDGDVNIKTVLGFFLLQLQWNGHRQTPRLIPQSPGYTTHWPVLIPRSAGLYLFQGGVLQGGRARSEGGGGRWRLLLVSAGLRLCLWGSTEFTVISTDNTEPLTMDQNSMHQWIQKAAEAIDHNQCELDMF